MEQALRRTETTEELREFADRYAREHGIEYEGRRYFRISWLDLGIRGILKELGIITFAGRGADLRARGIAHGLSHGDLRSEYYQLNSGAIN